MTRSNEWKSLSLKNWVTDNCRVAAQGTVDRYMSEELNTDMVVGGWDQDIGTPTVSKAKKPALKVVTGQTNAEEVEALIEKCLYHLGEAHEGKFDADLAQNVAAMFLSAQMKLSYFIKDIELRARQSKSEIQRVEAVKHQTIKAATTAKLTDAAVSAAIARDDEVVTAKYDWAEAEADQKKWNYLLSTLKEGHIFFRNLGKTQL